MGGEGGKLQEEAALQIIFLSCLHEGVLRNNLKLFVELWNQEKFLLKNFYWNFPTVLLLLLMFKLKHLGFRKSPKELMQGSYGILPWLGKMSCQLTHLCSCCVKVQLKFAASGSLGASGRVLGLVWVFLGGGGGREWGGCRALNWSKIKFHNISPLWSGISFFLWTAVMVCSTEQRGLPVWIRAMLLPTSGFELSWRIKGLWVEAMAPTL